MEAVKMQLKHGNQHVRTHADVSDPTLTGLKALFEVKEEVKDLMDIQIVAFPQEGNLMHVVFPGISIDSYLKIKHKEQKDW